MSNCLFFALWMWFRHPDSYLLIRRSHYYPGPHFMWGRRQRNGHWRVVHYVPVIPKPRLIPPLIFRGRLRLGDA